MLPPSFPLSFLYPVVSSNCLQALGAEVQRQRPVSITHPEHFVNVARRAAQGRQGALFADQFENLANFRAHLDTGREIWEQCDGRIDAFVCGSGFVLSSPFLPSPYPAIIVSRSLNLGWCRNWEMHQVEERWRSCMNPYTPLLSPPPPPPFTTLPCKSQDFSCLG